MYLICESSLLEEYLCEHEIVDYSHPLVQETIRQLHTDSDPETEHVRKTFEFVRDSIHHSWDIQSLHVTCKASEVLSCGLCEIASPGSPFTSTRDSHRVLLSTLSPR